MTKFLDTNRIWVMIGIVLTVILGGFVWWTGQSKINELDNKISEANLNQVHYMALISQRNALRAQYADLAKIYVGKKREVANLEAAFVEDINHVSELHKITFVGATFGQVNGSNPPPPNPYVDRNGQPFASGAGTATIVPTGNGQSTVNDLGGNAPGDPKSQRPVISPSLFTRVPVSVTLKGQWRNLAAALQDISKQDVLMSIADPEVRRLDKENLTLSFTAQILVPAVTIMENEIPKKTKTTNGTPKKTSYIFKKKTFDRRLHGPKILQYSDSKKSWYQT